MSIKSVVQCMFTPRLIKMYGTGHLEQLYEPNAFEYWGDKIINSLNMIWKFGVYTSPFLVGILYYKAYLVHDNIVLFTKLITSIGVILVVSFCLRGLGRAQNAMYSNFINVLNLACDDLTPATKQALARYDFEFSAWPVEYDWEEIPGEEKTERVGVATSPRVRSILALPCQIIAYLAVHTFGIRLIYPGSVGLLQMLLGPSLLQGRARLVENNKGMRYKLMARDENEIDAMFVDKRGTGKNGRTLAVCCEGNAGFYEIGIMGTAVEAGYSALGWNHPGFGGSTGKPFPAQEQNAVDIVMQFAINELGFDPDDIILFAWSIGGYAASWAAMNYPTIKGIVLDATFDDLMPLALNQMPGWWAPLVRLAIRDYVNLHNYEQLIKYPGPVLMIRRTEDEVICLRDSELASNRGNNLLIELLRYRFPMIVEERQVQVLRHYLSVTSTLQDSVVDAHGGEDAWCSRIIESYMTDNGKNYPMQVGEEMSNSQKSQMSLFLARKYMKDYKASHCAALPAEMLQEPWDVNVENGFVFT